MQGADALPSIEKPAEAIAPCLKQLLQNHLQI